MKQTTSARYVKKRFNDTKPLLTIVTELAVFAALFTGGAIAFWVALKIGASVALGIMSLI